MNIISYTFQDINNKNGGGIVNIIRLFIGKRAWQVLPLFRLCGYLKQNDSLPCKIFAKLCYRRYNKLCEIFNVYLPIDTKLGRHCIFPHFFPVVINPESNIGENCIIHPCVLIGRDRGKTGSPQIGNNCFIGHGAKIIGNPIVGDWSFISPGAIITKNIPESSLVGAGVNNIMSNKGKDHVSLYQC